MTSDFKSLDKHRDKSMFTLHITNSIQTEALFNTLHVIQQQHDTFNISINEIDQNQISKKLYQEY